MKTSTAPFQRHQIVRRITHPATGCMLLLALATSCSTLHIESAKNLAAIGKESTIMSVGNIFVSNDAYLRAMDAEAFFHGYAGSVVPPQLNSDYQRIQQELSARKVVFAKLSECYEAFHNLAIFNTTYSVESSINELGDAVNGYAKILNKNLLLSATDKNSIASIGGYATRRVHSRRVAQASRLIRERLEQLAKLLEEPSFKAQMTSFNQNLTSSRAATLTLLWERGLLDPTPLINELAGDAGLKAGKDAAKIISAAGGTPLKNGLALVVTTRMQRRSELTELSYDAAVAIIHELIARHRELENGEVLTPTELRGMITELQLSTDSLKQ